MIKTMTKPKLPEIPSPGSSIRGLAAYQQAVTQPGSPRFLPGSRREPPGETPEQVQPRKAEELKEFIKTDSPPKTLFQTKFRKTAEPTRPL
jgi:hypothetical protein